MIFVPRRGGVPKTINFVEYIESTGTQYVNTGIKPTNNLRVVMDAQLTSDQESPQTFLGTRSSDGSVTYVFWYVGSSTLRSDYGNTNLKTTDVGVTDRLLIDKNKNVCLVNNTTLTHTESTFQSTLDMFLFSLNYGGNVQYYARLKLYSCQIYDNDVLIRDYWPCYDPDGVACLYDKVNKEYVYNAGTGEFIAGMAA